MTGRTALCVAALALGATPLFAANPTSTFTLSELTAVPGKTLPPGQYTIHVVDHLSDRYVLEVEGAGGADQTLFLGIPDTHLPGSHTGMIRWSRPANQAAYIRGWRFPSVSTPLEFAYPKADAVAVAKANEAQVPAIDPESDHLPSNDLSKSQMQIVTLWLLTPTRVGPAAPAGISAKRYQEVASVTRPPIVKKLPHTASMLPWIAMAATFSLLGGLGFRMRALTTERQ